MKPPTLPLAVIATLVSCSILSRTLHSAEVDETFSAQINGTVHAVSVDATGAILVGGQFSQINGAPAANLAKLSSNGALESGEKLETDGDVLAIAPQCDGTVLIAGGFYSPAPGIARLLPDGALSGLEVGSGTSGRIDCLAVGADGSIYIGGPFRRLNGAEAIYAARLNAAGGIDGSFASSLLSSMSIEAGADAIAIQPEGKVIVGGNFNTADGFATLVRLNVDGSIDQSFNGDHGPILYPKVIQMLETGKIIIAGVANSSGSGFVRRLNSDGSVDSSFTEATFDTCVEAVAMCGDGSMLVGGSFSGGLAKLNADGVLDSSWKISTDGLVKAIALQGEDGAIVAGAFRKIGTHPSSGIARISLREALLATNSNGRFNARLQGEAGKRYEIQASVDLANWTVLGTAVASDEGIAVHDNAAASKTHRFFRARLIN